MRHRKRVGTLAPVKVNGEGILLFRGIRPIWASGLWILCRSWAIPLLMGLALPAHGTTRRSCHMVTEANKVIAGRGLSLPSLRQASAAGHHTAQILVSLYYTYRYPDLGLVHPRAKRQAILGWMQIAARGGNVLSTYLYDEEQIGIGQARHNLRLISHGERVISRAFGWLLKRAHQPCGALYEFAASSAYARGVGVSRNFRKSFLWARRSARHGSSLGAAAVGGYDLWGYNTQGYRLSCPKTMKWLRISMHEGNPVASVVLGRLYMTGGCQSLLQLKRAALFRSQQKGVVLFRVAAKRGVPWAYFHLGLCYIGGAGVRPNFAKGYLLLVRASRDGVKSAVLPARLFTLGGQMLIEQAYRDGHGLGAARQDMRALKTAALEGFKPAEQALKRLRLRARRSNEPAEGHEDSWALTAQ